MPEVNISELRQNLATYIENARRGVETRITIRGKVVARIVPDKDEQEAARARLNALRRTSWVGDVLSPSGIEWDVERARR